MNSDVKDRSCADGWFNVVASRCAYGATVDGLGGDGDGDDEVGSGVRD